MTRYRKKPVIIEAFQMTVERSHDNSEWPVWLHDAWNKEKHDPGAFFREGPYGGYLHVRTLEGVHRVTPGDWIIRGVQGELYPCKPDIFEATYEAVEEENDERPDPRG